MVQEFFTLKHTNTNKYTYQHQFYIIDWVSVIEPLDMWRKTKDDFKLQKYERISKGTFPRLIWSSGELIKSATKQIKEIK